MNRAGHGTIGSHAVVLRLVVLGTSMSSDFEMFLAKVVLAMVAFEGQEVDEVAGGMGALLSDAEKLGGGRHGGYE
jgi:hypothetical protein